MFLQISQRASIQQDWITILFFAILVLLFVINYFYNDKLHNTISLFLQPNQLQQKRVDFSVFFNRYHLLLFVLQTLILSFIGYLIATHFLSEQLTVFGVKLYGFIILGILVYYVFYYSTTFVLKELFDVQPLFESYFLNKFSYLTTLLILLLPLLLVTQYTIFSSEIFFQATLIIALLLMAWRTYLISSNNKKLIFSQLFYFILYLCTLEIAPVLVLWKLIK